MKTKLILLIGLCIGVCFIIYGISLRTNRVNKPESAAVLPNMKEISVISQVPSSVPVVQIATGSSLTSTFISPTGIAILAQRHPRKKTLPPAPVVSISTCISGGYLGGGTTIDGGNVNPPIQYAEISTDASFSHIFRRDMTGSISIEGFQGFVSTPSGNIQFVAQPNISYYIRFFNGLPGTTGYGPSSSFSFKSCS